MLTLQALSSSLNAGAAKGGCLRRGEALGALRQSVPQNGRVHLHIIERPFLVNVFLGNCLSFSCWYFSQFSPDFLVKSASFSQLWSVLVMWSSLLRFEQIIQDKTQKTREGCGCFWGLCRSSAGKFRENSEKIAGIFPESRNALNSGIRGTRKSKPAANIGPALPWTLCQPSVPGVFRNRQLQPSGKEVQIS